MRELRFFLSEAVEYLIRGKGTSFASVFALSSVLFLFALVLLVTHNLASLSHRLSAREGITVFFHEGLGADRAQELCRVFAGFGEVESVRFVDREEALAELERDLGGFSIAATLGDNPLPHTAVLSLRPEAIERGSALPSLAAELRRYEDVEDVVFGDEWVGNLDQALRRLRLSSVVIGALAALAVGIVLFTTLKLVFIARRETLRILKVVGATHRFIRSPFLLLGGLECLLGGGIALGLLELARRFLDTWVPNVSFLPAGTVALFLGGAVVYGVLAALLAIEPALRGLETRRDELLR